RHRDRWCSTGRWCTIRGQPPRAPRSHWDERSFGRRDRCGRRRHLVEVLVWGRFRLRLAFRAGALNHGASEHGLAGHLAVDVCLAFDAPGPGAEREHVDLNAELVAWGYGLAELGALDPGEDDKFLMTIGQLVRHDDAARLGHGLDHQHTRHDGMTGKMSLEERLVDGDVFDGDAALAGLEFNDAVNQEKRVAVREKTQDFLDVDDHCTGSGKQGRMPHRALEDYKQRCGAAGARRFSRDPLSRW